MHRFRLLYWLIGLTLLGGCQPKAPAPTRITTENYLTAISDPKTLGETYVSDPDGVLPPALRGEAPGSVDLGRNGTYLVVRTLAVDVAAFREHTERWAARTGLSVGQVAAKMVGRWPSGTSLTVSPDSDPGTGPVDNDFRYHRDGDALAHPAPIVFSRWPSTGSVARQRRTRRRAQGVPH